MMRRKLGTIAALSSVLVVTVCASAASPALIQLTQERALTANARAELSGQTPVNDNKSEAAAALGSFDRSFTSNAQVGQPPGIGWAISDALASQAVQIGPASIGGALAIDAHIREIGATSIAEADSDWRTTFRVDQAAPFSLTGRLRLNNISTGNLGGFSLALIFLRQPAGGGSTDTLYSFAVGGLPNQPAAYDEPVSVSGTLEPGYVYTLITGVSGTRDSLFEPADDKRTAGDITFNLNAVPEPSAAGLLALGATLLLRRRRSNRSRLHSGEEMMRSTKRPAYSVIATTVVAVTLY